MFRRITLACLVLSLPGLASAQRGGKRGTSAPDWDQMAKPTPATAGLTRKDVEEMDPVHRLIEKRKQLKLTEPQVTQLTALKGTASQRDESLLHAVDSLHDALKARPASDEDRLRMMAANRELAAVVLRIRARYDSAGMVALPLLDESQRSAATALLQEQQAEADAVIEKKMMGRGPSGGPGGPGGRPGGPPAGGRGRAPRST